MLRQIVLLLWLLVPLPQNERALSQAHKSSFELGIQVLELFGKASHCSHHPSPVLSGDLLPLTSKIRSDKVQPNIYFVLPLAEILAREVT